MNEGRYLVYLDILGFEALAEEIASKKGIDPRDIRKKFINLINEKIDGIETKGTIIGKKYEGSDSWLFVANSIDNIFYDIHEILNHNTGYKNYEKIPLEIAIGTGNYDKWASYNGINLIVENSTIKFLKTNIVGYYHKYNIIYNNESPRTTFIVVTESAYHELEPLDKTICKKIEYKHKTDETKEKVTIFYAFNLNKIQQRGRVFDFLEKIGHQGSKQYDRIDELYIQPLEYTNIKDTLLNDRIVFITGTPEFGKTYTAVRLMWEFYTYYGCEPKWIKGDEETERIEVRKRLEDIELELKHKHIIYFEDPFGKSKYEKIENLEREIGTIIERIKNVGDVYIIITSREEIFKEFEKEAHSPEYLKEFEIKLNIKKPSYNYESRKKILLKWAEKENCKWLEEQKLKDFILESIKYGKILSTPLSIKDFTIATKNITAEDEFKKIIEKKSKETAKSFSNEIKNMSPDKILFLSFPFISSRFTVDFIKVEYDELVKDLNIKDAWVFEKILTWFKDDKINISEFYHKNIEFSHPSYSEALEYLLFENGYIAQIIEIFTKVLFKLSDREEASGLIARFIKENFDMIPKNVRNDLLIKLSFKIGAAEYVVEAIAANFDELPENVGNLLFEHSEDKNFMRNVARAVAANFDKLPENIRNLLFKLSEDKNTAGNVAEAIAANFDKLPENVGNLLFNLSEDKNTAGNVAWAVAANFDKLSENIRNLLFKLSEEENAVKSVVNAVESYFYRLPDNVRNLLFKLSDKKETAGYVVEAVKEEEWLMLPEYARIELIIRLSDKEEVAELSWEAEEIFEKLPEDIKMKVLINLSEREIAAENLAKILSNNIWKLSEDVRNRLLINLSEKEEASEYIAGIVRDYFLRLPEDVRNKLLINLSDKEKVAGYISWTITENYNKLPENISNFLFKICDKEEIAHYVAYALTWNFDELPEDIRNNLLINLSDKEKAAGDVARVIIQNFDKIPENVRNELLTKLSNKKSASDDIAWILERAGRF